MKSLITKLSKSITINKFLIVPVIFTLVAALFFSSNVAAKPSVTRGPINCQVWSYNGLWIPCCQTETGKDGIEIQYCSLCQNTSPPSNCESRFQVSPRDLSNDPTGTKSGIDSGQLSTPPKSNDGASSKGGGDVGQPLTSTKGNSLDFQ